MTYVLPKKVVDAGGQVFFRRIRGKKVFVKKKRSNKNPLGWLAQRLLYRLTGNLLVLPPSRPVGDNVAFESGVLRRMREAGVRVPDVLYVDDDYFVMSDVGLTLEEVLRRQPELKDEYIDKAVRELRKLHDLGFAHGGSQIKNLTVKDGDIYFIDFEENIPEPHLDKFQIRDLFLLLLSLERHGHDPDLQGICRLYDGGGQGNSFEEIRKALRAIRIIRFLESRIFARLSMRDIRSLNRLIQKAASAGSPTLPEPGETEYPTGTK